MKDVIVGKIYFLLVRIKIKHMELSIIRRETTGAPPNQYNESETITKFEIMDGAPVRGRLLILFTRYATTNKLYAIPGETIPIRLFLGGFDLTPTFRDVNKKFSTRYYLNLVLIDEENRRYFKQQVRISFNFVVSFVPTDIAGNHDLPDTRSEFCRFIMHPQRLISSPFRTNADSVLLYLLFISWIYLIIALSLCDATLLVCSICNGPRPHPTTVAFTAACGLGCRSPGIVSLFFVSPPQRVVIVWFGIGASVWALIASWGSSPHTLAPSWDFPAALPPLGSSNLRAFRLSNSCALGYRILNNNRERRTVENAHQCIGR